jgi:ech hydrogenase subunit E
MGNRTLVPFGPQHPVLPEPIHLDLVVEDDKVMEAIPSIGFIHRGLEKLVEKREYLDMVYVAERICGICSFIHGLNYCKGVEEIMNIQVPVRAQYLRTIWSELSRVHSHVLWLGLLADAFGFENLFMDTMRIREQVLDIAEDTAGGRVIFGGNKVGGARRDISKERLAQMDREVSGMLAELKRMGDVFMKDYSVLSRLKEVGVLSKQDAYDLGCVGPMARGSGIAQDLRQTKYAAYGDLDFQPITHPDGDCFSRTYVRVHEIYQSIDLIRQAIAKIPDGPVDVKVVGAPNGEVFTRVEQPRGEVVYHIKGNGTRYLERFRVRTPTFANVPALVKMLQGCDLADVPVVVLIIDPCISCTER